MEELYCRSLLDVVKHIHDITEEELRDIAICCLVGLNDLHMKGLVHGVTVWSCY